MKIKPEEISNLIKEQIQSFNQPFSETDTGKVISVGDGIALVYGLEKAMMNELV
ncbi:MAG: F0F1 ATP synthase subunit alpha, partial [Firmicutes bacterium]|nr:F0F1 ATP synthase subunit alpha [Bacillota bacterium]